MQAHRSGIVFNFQLSTVFLIIFFLFSLRNSVMLIQDCIFFNCRKRKSSRFLGNMPLSMGGNWKKMPACSKTGPFIPVCTVYVLFCSGDKNFQRFSRDSYSYHIWGRNHHINASQRVPFSLPSLSRERVFSSFLEFCGQYTNRVLHAVKSLCFRMPQQASSVPS